MFWLILFGCWNANVANDEDLSNKEQSMINVSEMCSKNNFSMKMYDVETSFLNLKKYNYK